VNALAKSANIKELSMVGLVADRFEWEQKLEVVGDRVKVIWRLENDLYNFRPKTAAGREQRPISAAPSGKIAASANPSRKR
jgi:hypothetical protein